MEDKYLKLTNTVYKVLEFFPESDPLKHRAKDKALAIMEHLILVNDNSGWASFQKEKVKVRLLEDIDALLGYLWIGKAQGWLNSINCLIIANEYEKIRNGITPIVAPIVPDKSPEGHLDGPVTIPAQQVLVEEPKQDAKTVLNGRKGKILEFLNSHEKAQVMDLQTVLPDITKRTIRRDLDELLSTGKIDRTGDFNQVSYTLKR